MYQTPECKPVPPKQNRFSERVCHIIFWCQFEKIFLGESKKYCSLTTEYGSGGWIKYEK